MNNEMLGSYHMGRFVIYMEVIYMYVSNIYSGVQKSDFSTYQRVPLKTTCTVKFFYSSEWPDTKKDELINAIVNYFLCN